MVQKKKRSYRPDQSGCEEGLFKRNKALLRKSAVVCGICGLPLDKGLKYPDPMSVSIDHIIPINKGGKSTLDNLQATHLICNKIKGKGHVVEAKLKTKPKISMADLPQYIDWSSYDSDEN